MSSPKEDSALRDNSSSDSFANRHGEDGRISLDSFSHNLVGRIISFLRSHPKLCFFLLTLRIAEYIEGARPMYFLVLSPFYFFLQLALDAALYLPDAFLIREAIIRWKKGLTSVLSIRMEHFGFRSS